MDLGTLHSILTVVAFLTFIGIVIWAYSAARKPLFEQAARMPLEEDDTGVPASGERQ